MSVMVLGRTIDDRIRVPRLSVNQYDRMIKSGQLPDDDLSLELIDGYIVWKDRADRGEDARSIGNRHIPVLRRIAALAARLPPGCFVQTQQPIRLPPHSEPEPDGSIIRGDIATAHEKPSAEDVLVVIEAADSSLPQDRRAKRRAYALAGIP